jgi:hypothetical protein
MRLTISTKSDGLSVGHAAQLLASLVALRSGLALALSDEPDGISSRLNALETSPGTIVAELRRVGSALLDDDKEPPRIDRRVQALTLMELLAKRPFSTQIDFVLRSLDVGSVDIEIEDLLEMGEYYLKQFFSRASKGLLSHKSGEQVRTELRAAMKGEKHQRDRQEVAAGLSLAGATGLRSVLVEMGATDIHVDEEPKEAQEKPLR